MEDRYIDYKFIKKYLNCGKTKAYHVMKRANEILLLEENKRIVGTGKCTLNTFLKVLKEMESEKK